MKKNSIKSKIITQNNSPLISNIFNDFKLQRFISSLISTLYEK